MPKVRITDHIDPAVRANHNQEVMWRMFCAALLWKLVGPNKIVVVSRADIQAMHDYFKPDMGAVIAEGGTTATEFCLMSETRASILKGQRGWK